MTNPIAPKEMFDALLSWSMAAKLVESAKYPDLTQLLRPLERKPSGAVLAAELADYAGIDVVAFDIRGQGAIGVKTRHVLPAHFAVLRALELVPGLRVLLKDDKNRVRDKRDKRYRTEDEMIFNLSLAVSSKTAKRLKIFEQTKLDRILFNAAPDVRLYERRTGDYRYIVPSGSIPIRARARDAITQDSVLSAVVKLTRDNPSSAPAHPSKMRDLLQELFRIGDTWHWDDLLDRLPGDPSSKSA